LAVSIVLGKLRVSMLYDGVVVVTPSQLLAAWQAGRQCVPCPKVELALVEGSSVAKVASRGEEKTTAIDRLVLTDELDEGCLLDQDRSKIGLQFKEVWQIELMDRWLGSFLEREKTGIVWKGG
jgi:hypothetical protein